MPQNPQIPHSLFPGDGALASTLSYHASTAASLGLTSTPQLPVFPPTCIFPANAAATRASHVSPTCSFLVAPLPRSVPGRIKEEKRLPNPSATQTEAEPAAGAVMETKLILHPIPSKLQFSMAKSTHSLIKLSILRAAASPDSNSGQGSGGDGKESNGDAPNAAAERRASPAALNIRYRARSRRQARQEKQKQQRGLQNGPAPAKEWEEMTLSEKAMELYVGEKGLLFWLNKLAYASIFAVIGGWILFRFVGPSLGLYQLDGPPLSPASIFKGGSS